MENIAGNPIIGWNPIPKAARIYNSAVLPYMVKFVGTFRADQKECRATLFFGKSDDCDSLGHLGRIRSLG